MSEPIKKDNRGYLYPNKNKNKPTQPDFTGKALIDGKEWRIGAWENKTPEGNTYLSLSYTIPLPPQQGSDNAEVKKETESKSDHNEEQKISSDMDIDAILGMVDDEDPFN